MLRDTAGNPSFTHTIALVAFIVVMAKVLFGGSSMSVGGFSLSLGTIDGFSIGAILTPTLGAYVTRRWGTTTDDPGSKAGGG